MNLSIHASQNINIIEPARKAILAVFDIYQRGYQASVLAKEFLSLSDAALANKGVKREDIIKEILDL